MTKSSRADFITPEAYLQAETVAGTRHEYADGRIYAMTGASANHGRIVSNVSRQFGNHLEGGNCDVFSSDMKVRTPNGNYRYPDVMVVCNNRYINDNHATESPVIIVEVLSRSTRRIDEKIKLLEYINIPTLKEYVLIEQDIADISVLRKNNNWRTSHYFLGETIRFESIGLELSVEDIYQRVDNRDVLEFFADPD